MTVSNPNSVVEYTGNGTIAPIPVPYRFFKSSDLVVTKLSADGLVTTVLTLNIDYSVSGAGSLNGGTVTPASAVLVGERITVSRILPVQQLTDLRNQGNYFAEIHEDVFDYLTMLIQQALASLSKALLVQPNDPVPKRIAGAISRAGMLLGFDSNGDPIPVAPVSGSAADLALALANTTDPTKGAAMVGRVLFKGEALDPPSTTPSTSITRGYVFYYDPKKGGALRVGGSDTTPQNDERGYWSGLPSQNAWGSPANIGLYSQSFGRNGAAYKEYSTTFGHDCVTYGTASLAGGAGSATGNPGDPNSAFAGYCALAWGKNVLSSGEKSMGFGEEHILNTRAAYGLGNGVTSQPSVLTPVPVGAGGLGYNVHLFGQSWGLGAFLNVADGMLIGTGIVGGDVMQTAGQNELGLGYGSTLPLVRIKGTGVAGQKGLVGINNQRVLNHSLDIDVNPGARVAVTIDGTGTSTLMLGGLHSDGSEHPIAEIQWINPDLTGGSGELMIKMNGRSTIAFALKPDGTPVFPEMKAAGGLLYPVIGALYYAPDGTVKRVLT